MKSLEDLKIMGVLNLTPDSFSDGGKFSDLKQAIKRTEEMIDMGADFIDIGGESTGPGSQDVGLDEELNRVIPVLKELKKLKNIKISIDTNKPEVARIALENGADLINDVRAMREAGMSAVISEFQKPVVLMYSKDDSSRTTFRNDHYEDIIETLKQFFDERIAFAEKSGITRQNIILDPGMGNFVSANAKYSYEIIARLSELKEYFGLPILIGFSRKSFLGSDLEDLEKKSVLDSLEKNNPRIFAYRDFAGRPLSAIAYLNGASIIRTHDVRGVKNFLKNLEI